MVVLAQARGDPRDRPGDEHPHVRNPQNRNSVAVIMDVPKMDAVMALMDSDEGKASMEYDGVPAETIAIFIEE